MFGAIKNSSAALLRIPRMNKGNIRAVQPGSKHSAHPAVK